MVKKIFEMELQNMPQYSSGMKRTSKEEVVMSVTRGYYKCLQEHKLVSCVYLCAVKSVSYLFVCTSGGLCMGH